MLSACRTTEAELLSLARARVRVLGRSISPSIHAECKALFGPLHDRAASRDVRVERDIPYGADARHRLDVFTDSTTVSHSPRSVLVFVHGGGFVQGDKQEDGGPFHDNVGVWAASQGYVGVTINYRLAPEHVWPAGAEDVARAVDWLQDNVEQFGGDPGRVFVMGHSAGAAHVAGLVSSSTLSHSHRLPIAGVICASGIYDLRIMPVSQAYFGEPSSHAQRTPLHGLGETQLPLLLLVAELDPPIIERHFVSVLEERVTAGAALPHLGYVAGHNHFSTIFHLGTVDETLALQITTFISTVVTPRNIRHST